MEILLRLYPLQVSRWRAAILLAVFSEEEKSPLRVSVTDSKAKVNY